MKKEDLTNEVTVVIDSYIKRTIDAFVDGDTDEANKLMDSYVNEKIELIIDDIHSENKRPIPEFRAKGETEEEVLEKWKMQYGCEPTRNNSFLSKLKRMLW